MEFPSEFQAEQSVPSGVTSKWKSKYQKDAVTKLDGYRSYQAPTGKLRQSAGVPNELSLHGWASHPHRRQFYIMG